MALDGEKSTHIKRMLTKLDTKLIKNQKKEDEVDGEKLIEVASEMRNELF